MTKQYRKEEGRAQIEGHKVCSMLQWNRHLSYACASLGVACREKDATTFFPDSHLTKQHRRGACSLSSCRCTCIDVFIGEDQRGVFPIPLASTCCRVIHTYQPIDWRTRSMDFMLSPSFTFSQGNCLQLLHQQLFVFPLLPTLLMTTALVIPLYSFTVVLMPCF